MGRARPEAVGHRVNVGVDARADVLQVDDEKVEARQHRGGRLTRLAIERVDRDVEDRVADMVGLDHVVLDVRAEPVLRSEHRRQRDTGQRGDGIGDVPEPGVHRCRVRDQTDPLAGETGGQARGSESNGHRGIIGKGARRTTTPGRAGPDPDPMLTFCRSQ